METFKPPLKEKYFIIPENVKGKINKETNFVIITAPAGYGKTTLLTILYYKLNCKKLWIDCRNVGTDLNEIESSITDPPQNLTLFLDNFECLKDNEMELIKEFFRRNDKIKVFISSRKIEDLNFFERSDELKKFSFLNEKNLNFTTNDIGNILKRLNIDERYSDLIFLKTKGYPLFSTLLCLNIKNGNNIGQDADINFILNDMLKNLSLKIKNKLFTLVLLPEKIFNKIIISEFPKYSKELKIFPLTIYDYRIEIHPVIKEFLIREAKIQTSKRELINLLDKEKKEDTDVFYKIYLHLLKKEWKKLNKELKKIKNLYDFLNDPENKIRFHNTFYEDINLLFSEILEYPYILIYFSILFLSFEFARPLTDNMKSKILSKLKEYLNVTKNEWKIFALYFIIDILREKGDDKKVLRYSSILLKEKSSPKLKPIISLGIANSLQSFANCGMIDKVDKLYQKSRKWAEESNYIPSFLLSIANYISILTHFKGDFSKIEILLNEGIVVAKKYNNLAYLLRFYTIYVEFFLKKKEFENAIHYADLSLKIAELRNLDYWKKVAYNSYFLIYKEMKNFPKMEWAYENVFKYSNLEDKRLNLDIPYIKWMEAEILFLKGLKNEALELLETSEEICSKNEIYKPLLLSIIKTKNKILVESNETAKIKDNLIKYIELTKKLQNWENYIEGCVMLLKILKSRKEKRKLLYESYNYIEKYKLYNLLSRYPEIISYLYKLKIKDESVIRNIQRKVGIKNRLFLLGKSKILYMGEEKDIYEEKVLKLLTILVYNYKEKIVRDKLIETLYPNYFEKNKGLEKAKNNLRKTASRSNKLLKGRFVKSIPTPNGGYYIDFNDDYTCDLLDFIEAAKKGLKTKDIPTLEQAEKLYKGNLLGNIEYLEREIEDIREKVKNLYKNVLYVLKSGYSDDEKIKEIDGKIEKVESQGSF